MYGRGSLQSPDVWLVGKGAARSSGCRQGGLEFLTRRSDNRAGVKEFTEANLKSGLKEMPRTHKMEWWAL